MSIILCIFAEHPVEQNGAVSDVSVDVPLVMIVVVPGGRPEWKELSPLEFDVIAGVAHARPNHPRGAYR